MQRLPVSAGRKTSRANKQRKYQQANKKPHKWELGKELGACSLCRMSGKADIVDQEETVKKKLNLGKKFPKCKMKAHGALCHKDTVD